MGRYKVYPSTTPIYFSTSTIVEWQCVFKEEKYFQIIIDALDYCRTHKGLFLGGYVIMLNHIHLCTSNKDTTTLSEIMRDFKRHTSKLITAELQKDNERLLLHIFRQAAQKAEKGVKYKVWQDDFHPEAILSQKWLNQKLDYIHHNPVKKGFVTEPQDWKYSSARNWLLGDNSIISLDPDHFSAI